MGLKKGHICDFNLCFELATPTNRYALYLIGDPDGDAVGEVDVEVGEVLDGGRDALLDGAEEIPRVLLHPTLPRMEALDLDLVV